MLMVAVVASATGQVGGGIGPMIVVPAPAEFPDRANGPESGMNGLLAFGVNPASPYVPGTSGHLCLVDLASILPGTAPAIVMVPLPTSQTPNVQAPLFPNNLTLPPGATSQDDAPQGLLTGAFTASPPGQFTIMHRRSQVHPLNTGIAGITDDRPGTSYPGRRVILAAPVKWCPNQTGVALFDLRPNATLWPNTAYVAPTVLPAAQGVPTPSEHVLSDISPDVSCAAIPLGFAYVTGSQWTSDFSTGGTNAPTVSSYGPSMLRIINATQTVPPVGTPPPTSTYILGTASSACGPFNAASPTACHSLSPYASRILLWPRRGRAGTPPASQFAYVPLATGVEIVNLGSGTPTFARYYPAPPNYEVCSEISWFGRDPQLNNDTFCVLVRPGPSSHAAPPNTAGLQLLVFDRFGRSKLVSFTTASAHCVGLTNYAIDVNRGGNEIVVAPPAGNTPAAGRWYTAFIPLYGSGTGVPGNPVVPFGLIASVENLGVGPGIVYSDGGFPTTGYINVPSIYPVRYHGPTGATTIPGGLSLFPYQLVPIGIPSSVPPGLAGDPGTHPNLVAWYFGSEVIGGQTALGVAVLNARTIGSGVAPTFMQFIDARYNREPIVRRPLWGYMAAPCGAMLHVQHDIGLETLRVAIASPAATPVLTSGQYAAPFPTIYDNMKRRHAVFNPPQDLQSAIPCALKYYDVAIAQMQSLAAPGLMPGGPGYPPGVPGDDEYVVTAAWPSPWCPPGGPNPTFITPPQDGSWQLGSWQSYPFGLATLPDIDPTLPWMYAPPFVPFYRAGIPTIPSSYSNPLLTVPWILPAFYRLQSFPTTPVALASPLPPTEWVANGGTMEPRFNMVDYAGDIYDCIFAAYLNISGATTACLVLDEFYAGTCNAPPGSTTASYSSRVVVPPGGLVGFVACTEIWTW